MGRILISGFLLVVVGIFLFMIFLAADSSYPTLTAKPSGISQSTVSEVRIPSSDLLSGDGGKVWVRARVGEETPRDAAILVNLSTGDSEYMVESAEPEAWLDENTVLFRQEVNCDPFWKKIVRSLGGHLPRRHATHFYRVDLASGSVSTLAEIESESTLMFCNISPDHRWMIASWGPVQAHEISLETGTVSPRIDEKYIWAPSFISADTYLFVGETALQSRQIGGNASERASQPLLQEIRDAIKLKGTPSIEVCGRNNGVIYVVDHVPDGRFDRLLKLDERTRIIQEVTQLAPSRTPPVFSPDGLYLTYQGNPFDRTQDTVYFQETLDGSKPVILVRGISGQVNEADPVFINGDRILYVHRGTELRSIHPNEEQPALHWPQSLLP